MDGPLLNASFCRQEGRAPRILFLLSTTWGSSVMRGRLMHSVLSQTRHEHGVDSEIIYICARCDRKPSIKSQVVLSPLNQSLSRHSGTVCVCVKFCRREAAELCQSHRAPVLWDVIDNFRESILPNLLCCPTMRGHPTSRDAPCWC